MASWGFLTNHARVLLCIAHDPGARLRDIAASLGITERSAHGIVTDLAEAGYVIRQKDGRRNRYRSRPTCRCPSPAPGNPPSARSSPCSQPRPAARTPAGCRRIPAIAERPVRHRTSCRCTRPGR
jgi:MarR family